MTTSSTIFYSAKAHASVLVNAGYSVFICNQDKSPYSKLAPKGYLSATNDPKVIANWNVPHDSVVGIACRQSRILVVDCDMKTDDDGSLIDGISAFQNYCIEKSIDLSAVPCVSTPSGGYHYYFYLPDSFTHGNGEGELPDGINIRCAGYVIAFGSTLTDGRAYNHISGSFDSMSYVPEALQNTLKATKNKPPKKKQKAKKTKGSKAQPINKMETFQYEGEEATDREIAYAKAVLFEETQTLASTASGGRNNQLFRSTAAIFNCVASGWLAHDEAEAAIYEACQKNGLINDDGHNKFYRSLSSAIYAGLSTPREPLNDAESASESNFSAPIIWDGKHNGLLRDELVKGLLSSVGPGLIAGQSGAGKSFISLKLALDVSTGHSFFGHKVKQRGGAFMLLAEGIGTMPERMEALRKSIQENDQPPFDINSMPIAWRQVDRSLFDKGMENLIIEMIKEIKQQMLERYGIPLRLVMIDTIAAAFLVEDENNPTIATKVMQMLERISRATDTLVLGITHFGKAVEAGVRGSSGYTASSDVILAVHADKDIKGKVKSRFISLHKSRTHETGIEYSFRLKPVLLGVDEDGDEIRSCYVGEECKSNTDAAKPKLTSSMKILLKSVDEAITATGEHITPYGYKSAVIGTSKEALREAFYRNYNADGDTPEKQRDAKRKQLKRMMSACIDTYIGFQEIDDVEWVWKLDNATPGLTGGSVAPPVLSVQWT